MLSRTLTWHTSPSCTMRGFCWPPVRSSVLPIETFEVLKSTEARQMRLKQSLTRTLGF